MLNKFKLGTTNSVETKSAITRTLEIANSYAGELSIEVLPLDKIEIDPENKRELVLTLHDAINGINKDDPEYEKKKQNWKSLESLAKTIRDDQLINPIYVYRFGNKCRLIAGERRTLASAIAGKKEIIARIASQRPVGTKLRVLQWVENNERSELSLSERIASLESIIQEYCAENKEVANKERITAKLLSDLTGMSITQARRYILILQSNSEIRQAINEGKLENIKLIEIICSTENLNHQRELLIATLSGASFESISKLKKDIELEQKRVTEKKRGRKKVNVSLGSVKPNVAKIIVNALVNSNILEKKLTKQITTINGDIDWKNNNSVEKIFKKIMSLLAKEESNT